MKKLLLILLLTLSTSLSYALDIDLNANNAVDIEFGGTDAVTASAARTSLGLAIGTNVQAYDADLTTYGSITPSTDVQSILSAADYTAIKSLLGIESSTGHTAWTILYNNGAGSITELPLGVTGTALLSSGINSAPYFGAVAGGGGGTIGGTLGSTDNAILRADGVGGVTAQGSVVTISDVGTINIPTGQTYQINGAAHTHNYQPLDADLTTYAGITPSANTQAYLAAADYSAMRTLLSLVPGTNVQAYDADLLAIAAISPVRGDIIAYGAAGWTNIAKGTLAQVLTQGASDPVWADSASGINTWDEIGDAALDATIDLAGYKTTFTSSLDTGAIWTMTNTDASLSAATSFVDMKATANGDSNLYFMRGYDNAGADIKWSIGPEGAFYGYSYETAQSTTGGVLDLLEGSGGGTDYIRLKADDDVGTNRKLVFSTSVSNTEDLSMTFGVGDNTVTLGSSTGVDTFSFTAINVVTTGTISGKIPTVVENTATTWNITTAQARAGTFFINTNAGTKTFVLPAAEAGMAACAKNGQGVSQILRIDTDGTDYIVKPNGSRTTSAGDYYGATASAGNQICVVAFDTTDWYVTSETGTWTEE